MHILRGDILRSIVARFDSEEIETVLEAQLFGQDPNNKGLAKQVLGRDRERVEEVDARATYISRGGGNKTTAV